MKSERLPKVENMLAFLKARGWTLAEKNRLYYIMNPPPDMVFEKPFQYYVPIHEHFMDYPKLADLLVNSFSELFDLDYNTLWNVLCQSKNEMKKAIELRHELLAQAA